MEYSALDVAKYIVNFCYKNDQPISNLQLQKILYYVQGYSMALLDKDAYEDEILVWKYGPVVKEAYEFFSNYAAEPIRCRFDSNICGNEQKLIDIVTYKKMYIPVWKLVEDTHKEMPWKITNEVYGLGSVIPKNFIKDYFVEQLVELENDL